MFNPNEDQACRQLVELALKEDLGSYIDLTSHAFVSSKKRGTAVFVGRASGTIAGLPAVAMVLQAVDQKLAFEPLVDEGAAVRPGVDLARATGSIRSILTAERTALNFFQHLSGWATA